MHNNFMVGEMVLQYSPSILSDAWIHDNDKNVAYVGRHAYYEMLFEIKYPWNEYKMDQAVKEACEIAIDYIVKQVIR